jgi:hypothetical protein
VVVGDTCAFQIDSGSICHCHWYRVMSLSRRSPGVSQLCAFLIALSITRSPPLQQIQKLCIRRSRGLFLLSLN